MPHRRLRRQNLHVRRDSPYIAQDCRRILEPRNPEGRRRHDPPPELRRVRFILPRGLHDRGCCHHRQPVLHRRRDLQAVHRLQGEADHNSGNVRGQAPQPRRRMDPRRGLQGRDRRRSAGELPPLLGALGGRRERRSGGGDPPGRRGGASVLLRHHGVAERSDSDSQELNHERGATGGRREP